MLEIVTGRTGSGKTALCLERIEEKLFGEPAGQKIILLLPEHMTYRVERQLASLLAKKGRGSAAAISTAFVVLPIRFCRKLEEPWSLV